MKVLHTYLEESLSIGHSPWTNRYPLQNENIKRALNILEPWMRKYSIQLSRDLFKVEIDGRTKLGVLAKSKNSSCALFLWSLMNTEQVDAVAFAKEVQEFPGEHKFDLLVLGKGASISKLCELAVKVLTEKIPMDWRAVREYVYDFLGEDPHNGNWKTLAKTHRSAYDRLHRAKLNDLPVDQLQAEYDDSRQKMALTKEGIFTNVIIKCLGDIESMDKFS